MFSVKIKTDVSTEPILAATVKTDLGIDFSDHDTLLGNLIKASREWCEGYCDATFAPKTLIVRWDELPSDQKLYLPQGPIDSVTSVKTVDQEGTETTLTLNTDYYVRGKGDIYIAVQSVWSSIVGEGLEYEVEYVAGYGGTNTEACPYIVKQAIEKLVAENYKNRENTVVGTIISKVPNDVREMLSKYRRTIWF